MKRVLITGAGGFIGRHCLIPIQGRGYEIHAVSSRSMPKSGPDVSWHKADLLDNQQVIALLAEVQPSHLLHLAWYAVPGKYWTSAANLLWVRASLDLLHSFADFGGKRVVMVGTCAEYDWKLSYFSEKTSRLLPATLYGTCKHALQLILAAYAGEANLSAAWARLFFVYGPHEHPDRLVASTIRSLLQNQEAPCSQGEQQRDFLYVEDVASALVALLESDVRGAINVASGRTVLVREIVEEIGRLLERTELIRFGALPERPNEPLVLAADINRLSEELMWKPAYDLSGGLTRTIHWWEEQLVAP